MEFIDDKTIKLDKELSELDEFVLDFLNVLKKYVDYVIVSGYSAIILGRARSTEDVDILIKNISEEQFKALYDDLFDAGYWFLTVGDSKKLYEEISKNHVRIALQGEVLPNVELKITRNELDEKSLVEPVTVKLARGDVKIGPIEIEIPYKEVILGSRKDLEDARHLQDIFEGHINHERLEEYKTLIKSMWNERKI